MFHNISKSIDIDDSSVWLVYDLFSRIDDNFTFSSYLETSGTKTCVRLMEMKEYENAFRICSYYLNTITSENNWS